jgi:hypothetical protein
VHTAAAQADDECDCSYTQPTQKSGNRFAKPAPRFAELRQLESRELSPMIKVVFIQNEARNPISVPQRMRIVLRFLVLPSLPIWEAQSTLGRVGPMEKLRGKLTR